MICAETCGNGATIFTRSITTNKLRTTIQEARKRLPPKSCEEELSGLATKTAAPDIATMKVPGTLTFVLDTIFMDFAALGTQGRALRK